MWESNLLLLLVSESELSSQAWGQVFLSTGPSHQPHRHKCSGHAEDNMLDKQPAGALGRELSSLRRMSDFQSAWLGIAQDCISPDLGSSVPTSPQQRPRPTWPPWGTSARAGRSWVPFDVGSDTGPRPGSCWAFSGQPSVMGMEGQNVLTWAR